MSEPYYADDRVTLYLGDCREVTEWLAADVLCTDPPYGMAFDSGRVKGRTRPISNDRDTTARDAALALWGDRPGICFGTWRVPRSAGQSQVVIWDKTDGGSTLIAAHNLGRHAIGVEIEERYAEIIALRLAQDCLPLGGI